MKVLKRFAYIIVLFLLIISIFHFSYANQTITTFDFIKNPSKYHGINKTIMGPYGGDFPGGFTIIYNKRPTPILYDSEHPPPKFGEVKAYVTANQDNTIQALAVHNYDYNYFLIYGLSFIALIIIILYLKKDWKLSLRGFKDA